MNRNSTKVLTDGYGQCNTKGILFMALLRAVGVPCRLHRFIINKELQKGIILSILYKLVPIELFHSWVEVYYSGNWLNMEGFILDNNYLKSVRKIFQECKGLFCGYAIATDDFKNPQNEWTGESTYIQKEKIIKDLGIYDSPDEFYKKYGSNLHGIKKIIYKYFVRKIMNRNVEKIRTFWKKNNCTSCIKLKLKEYKKA